MSQYFEIHPETPQPRLVQRTVEILDRGGLIVYPTDSSYAFGCRMGDKAAVERMRRLRQADRDHNFTLVCADLSQISTYAKLENPQFRLLNSVTPGPYTFILRATHEVPRRLWNPKRKTIGIRVPDHPVPVAIVEALGEPIMSSTLILPEEELPLTEPSLIRERLEHEVDLVVDSGNCGVEPTTVVDLTDEVPQVLRVGRGPIAALGLDEEEARATAES